MPCPEGLSEATSTHRKIEIVGVGASMTQEEGLSRGTQVYQKPGLELDTRMVVQVGSWKL